VTEVTEVTAATKRLLDTHLVLWAAYEPNRLSAAAKKLMQNREQPLLFSLATLWEVAIKSSLGRPDFSVDVGDLREGLLNSGFLELPIQAAHLCRVATLPWVHRDPFDRLLVAQAITENAQLLTADRTLKGYGRFVRVI
jgi:PIN domain nuclease of toxin-antitoxin system